MGAAGNSLDQDKAAADLAKERQAKGWYGADPTKDQALAANTAGDKGALYQRYLETSEGKSIEGDSYIDPLTGRSANAPPQQADLTDQLLQKTRTNFALRLQAGNNQQSSFGGSQSGGLVLGGSKAGGY